MFCKTIRHILVSRRAFLIFGRTAIFNPRAQLLVPSFHAAPSSCRWSRSGRVNDQAHYLVVLETGMRGRDIMNQVNQLILSVSRALQFLSGLDGYLIRGAMVFTFFAFSIQKWSLYTVEMLVPLISHSPVVFWLLPAFGVRGAGYLLGTTETIFGSFI